MSVYTPVSEKALSELLRHYSIGTEGELQGIHAGIDNSNYFLTTQTGEYVLTVFETLSMQQIPFCMELMHFLARHGVPCAHPVAADDGRYVVELLGKPASIVNRLAGNSVTVADQTQLQALGTALGRWHRIVAQEVGSLARQRDNRYGKQWRHEIAARLSPQLPANERQLLQQELSFQQLYRFQDLPAGIIHGDLFRDNALFVGPKLNGIIDLYAACTGPFLYDIAVVVNDWCRNDVAELDVGGARYLLQSYHAQRPLGALERGFWPVMLRAAALRFWLSRLEAEIRPKKADLVTKKNPQEYKNILQNCILEESILTDLWVL